jgi:hypothetical protein
MLYPTNGEYTDFASATFGTVSINPELTSGYGPDGYYGFEFPDDETLLQQLFTDNLPFALDAIEMARDPVAYVSPSTGLRADRWVLESGSPVLRLRGPAGSVATAALTAAGQKVALAIDTVAGGKYARRLLSQGTVPSRPSTISVSSGTERVSWSLLVAAGAETADSSWTRLGFTLDSAQRFVGRASYRASGAAELRSARIAVPAITDTVSLTFWTRYEGDGFSERPYGVVRVSSDSGKTWNPIVRLAGWAPVWYPEDVRIGGVRGKTLTLSFLSLNLSWWIDEVTVYAHGASSTTGGTVSNAVFVPSANPVRGTSVTFTWPFTGKSGTLRVYDFTGRLVWSHDVPSDADDATWDLSRERLPNGVYLVLAESGSAHARLKLFVAREAP